VGKIHRLTVLNAQFSEYKVQSSYGPLLSVLAVEARRCSVWQCGRLLPQLWGLCRSRIAPQGACSGRAPRQSRHSAFLRQQAVSARSATAAELPLRSPISILRICNKSNTLASAQAASLCLLLPYQQLMQCCLKEQIAGAVSAFTYRDTSRKMHERKRLARACITCTNSRKTGPFSGMFNTYLSIPAGMHILCIH